MAPETPIVGQIIGHYRVLEQIGAGGMGLVPRASDQQLERDVAIKVLPPGMLADEDNLTYASDSQDPKATHKQRFIESALRSREARPALPYGAAAGAPVDRERDQGYA
ncbi:MAG: hypothetical protein WA232_01125 [Candidatus Sulfotelmatobacter sp.]